MKSGVLEKYKAGDMWRFHVILRKLEYTLNCRKGLNKKICNYYRWRLQKVEMKLGWSIPPNVFGPGLCIVHFGTVVVNDKASVGKNCRIQAGVNIGANGGQEAPVLGDNVYIGPGAKVFGGIRLGSDIAIGANAVVNKSIEMDHVSIAGIPAAVVSDKGSERFIFDVCGFVDSECRDCKGGNNVFDSICNSVFWETTE